jgi:hypothetical protein
MGASKPSKKQVLLEFFEKRGMRRIEAADLHAGKNELHRHLGNGDRTGLGYIVATLRKAGYDVRYEDHFSDPVMPEPYSSRLKDVLEFRDLPAAEQSLLRLDEIYRQYQSTADRAGINWIRTLVKKGKLRARSLSGNPRVQQAKRLEKQEIANWFQVWLETPELFADWLILRKSSEEFQRLFAAPE